MMTKYMFIRKWFAFSIILYSCGYSKGEPHQKSSKCLTGYMTDVQSWVDENGVLQIHRGNPGDVQNWIDLSTNTNPVQVLHQKMTVFRASNRFVKYLSMARCKLSRVPPVFELQDSEGRCLSETIEYMTFYGNTFVSNSEAGDQYDISLNATSAVEVTVQGTYNSQVTTLLWSAGFQDVKFTNLKELDLRACSIQLLNADLFKDMRSLQALYIGENEIHHIDSQTFNGLNNLLHIDISRNQGHDINGNPRNLISDFVFDNLPSLMSLDLSYTRLTHRNIGTLRGLGKSLKSLSICETGLRKLPEAIFSGTSLQILDVSRNSGILTNETLKGLENTLQVLYAKEIGLQTMDIFENFTKLEILRLSYNEINAIRAETVKTLQHLTILDLNKNRLTTWFEPTYSLIPKLKVLSLKDNNINLISEEMIEDTANISYLALSGNFIVCNCHVKDFYKMAAMNERKQNTSKIKTPKNQMFHRGYDDYNMLITKRNVLEFDCENQYCDTIEDTGVFRILDYTKGAYCCLMIPSSKSVMFSDVDGCGKLPREIDYDYELAESRRKLLVLLVLPCVLLPLAILFVFRRNLRYCCIMIKNSTMIGLINNKDIVGDDTIFNYDVFVSYCNEDRGWVLDHLLPHMEADCSISACLHERDFQVGLSILENIVSCMDRSRSIMLIISQRFLLSQWCQFEMHLAQHRLLETRREDLTLVLLEDIPRRLRPNTLHYLMLTKTYIVWPKEESERQLFWRRLKKSLLSRRVKQGENVSLA